MMEKLLSGSALRRLPRRRGSAPERTDNSNKY